jgi:hypothetical protein
LFSTMTGWLMLADMRSATMQQHLSPARRCRTMNRTGFVVQPAAALQAKLRHARQRRSNQCPNVGRSAGSPDLAAEMRRK